MFKAYARFCEHAEVTNPAPGVRFSDDYRTVPEGRIIEMLLLAGWAYEQDNPDARAATRRALDNWTAMGLGVRLDATGERLFDPVEVANVLKRLGLEGRDSFWIDRYVNTGRRLVTDMSSRAGRTFTVNFRRTFSLRSVPVGRSLRLRVPLPLLSVHGEDLDVAPFIEGSSSASLTINPGRLEARLAAAGEDTVTVGARLTFTGARLTSPASPSEFSSYLKPREGLVVITNRVNELAYALAGPSANARSVVLAFWNYLLDHLACGAIHYDQIRADSPCDFALETGWYDCQLGSALFIALCRARGIPARLVGGHVLYRPAPTNHYWAEVWFEESGWTPFDFLSWDLSHGGHDSDWRGHFYGRIDDRMITQLFPFEFTGALGVTMPNAWHIIQTAKNDGVEISLLGLDGNPVYSDFVSVTK